MASNGRRASRGISAKTLWTAVALVAAAGLIAGAWLVLRDRMPPAAVEFAELPSGDQWGLAAVFPDKLDEPLGLTAADGRLWVAESGASAIVQLGPAGQRIASMTVDSAGGVPSYPNDVAFSGNRLIVVDQAGRGRVVSMERDGRDQKPFTAQQLINPTAVAADGQDAVFVADAATGTIHRFDASGAQSGVIGAKVDPRLGFVGGMRPVDGRLWVSDSNARRVEPIDLGTGVSGERLPGKMGLPRGVEVDEFGRIYVADEFSGVVRMFDPDGSPVAEIGRQDPAAPASDGALQAPTDVAWLEGRLYVTDRADGRIKVFNIRAP